MGGAFGIDSSTVPSPISISSRSDVGKSTAGGEDICEGGSDEKKCKKETRRVASISG